MIDINLDNLESFPKPSRIVERYFIYFLMYKNQVVYIGKTVSVQQRILAHLTDKLFDSYKYIELNTSVNKEAMLVERYYITKYSPIFNDSITATYKTKDEYFDRLSATLLTKDKIYVVSKRISTKLMQKRYKLTDTILYSNDSFYVFEFNNNGEMTSFTKDNKDFKINSKVFIEEYDKIKELLPNHDLPEENGIGEYIFNKGKYKDKKYKQVLREDASYIQWMIDKIPDYKETMLRPKLSPNLVYNVPVKYLI